MLKTLEKVDPAFRADVLNGLSEPIPAIPARWFYDRRGSELFDEITRLPSYYPTRTETALLEAKIAEIARLLPTRLRGGRVRRRAAATKTPILLRAARPKAYVPIDIIGRLSARERGVGRCRISLTSPVHPVEADFTKDVAASGGDRRPAAARLLPRLDHRQFRAAERDRPAAPFPRRSSAPAPGC